MTKPNLLQCHYKSDFENKVKHVNRKVKALLEHLNKCGGFNKNKTQ